MEFPVSVVVAVPRRPAGEQRFLLRRALESVERQTLQPLEVIVVLDGPNASVCRELFRMDIQNLQIVMQEGQTSKLNAWQVGINNARGAWVALLHDEDEWQPEKLAEQRQLAQQSQHKFPVVSCRLTMVSEAGEELWPRRLPHPEESIGDYLFRRNSGFLGEGLMHRSTLLFPTALARAFPLRLPTVPPLGSDVPPPTAESIAQDDERGWLLRIARVNGVGFELHAMTGCISRWDRLGLHPNPRNRQRATWQASLAWIQQHRQHLSAQAYQTFILTEVAANASQAKDRKAFTQLLRAACEVGLPTPRLLLIYLSLWLIKPQQRQRVRNYMSSRLGAGSASGHDSVSKLKTGSDIDAASDTHAAPGTNAAPDSHSVSSITASATPISQAPNSSDAAASALVPVTVTQSSSPSLGGRALSQQINGVA